MTYHEFLRSKEISPTFSGFDVDRDNPKLFQWQSDIVRWALKKGRCAIFSSCGTGKGQPYGSKVLTPYGWKEIQTLNIGDKVISSDGKAYNVKGVFPKEEIETYRFYYSDRTSCVFDKDHLHIVRKNHERERGKPFRVMSTVELLECGNLRYGKDGKSRNYDIPVVKPVEYEEKEVMISPYIVGVLLGDGYLTKNVKLTSPDNELIDRVITELPKGVTLKKVNGQPYDYIFISGLCGNKKHFFRQELDDLGMLNKHSWEKEIPQKYMYLSVLQRLDLLRGLMDTDGYIAKCGTAHYYSASEKLRNDVVELVQSLGGCPTKTEKQGSYKDKNGNKVECRKCYIATFSLKTFNPFYIERKAKLWNPTPRDNGRWIDRIEFEKIQKTVCISVDSPDNSYVTENFVVTHNTSMQLQWAQMVVEKENKPVLIVAPLAVAKQTQREGVKFDIPVTVCRTQEDVKPGVNVTNYEMLQHFNPPEFVGVVLDESSILKAYTGKIKREIIGMFKYTKYKLSCTATPAPNDLMELLNQAEFLGIMKSNEALSCWFIADQRNSGHYRLKVHAEKDFWRWVSSWAVCIEKPSDIGYTDEGYILPCLTEKVIIVDKDEAQDQMQAITEQLNMNATGYHREKKKTIKNRVAECAKLVNNSDAQFIVWCYQNEEADLLKEVLNDCIEVRGSDTVQKKEQAAIDFADGKIRVLISKASIFGYGLNFQNCHNMIFCGMDYSFESYYQAVRRVYRFGQNNPVTVWKVIGKDEEVILDAVMRKEKIKSDMNESMSEAMKDFQNGELHGKAFKLNLEKQTANFPMWIKTGG